MADVLLAITKGLAGVPGLGPIFNPLVALRDEEKAARANEVLLEKISEGHEISKETLDGVLVQLLGIHADNQAIRQQMIGGFHAVIGLILQQQEDQINISDRNNESLIDAPNLEEAISALIQGNTSRLAAASLLTIEALRDELVSRFSGGVATLLAIAQPAGFPKGWVAEKIPPIQAYYQFLEQFYNLEKPQQARITRAISQNIPGSRLLRTWSEVYCT